MGVGCDRQVLSVAWSSVLLERHASIKCSVNRTRERLQCRTLER
ncbi:hypothetical protein I551_5347 [Mycobacterium ulcerans str. Harvey]|uniref:Uncharacterized protein n=1 Tax=Mycobacterium ulcerans str. Harvey TaxID=1299332 RepID=A0ABP3ADW4_MYCUL|nr:hypothetical protein I551_5347 [Mycobacterium ulcerans str. Harvey]